MNNNTNNKNYKDQLRKGCTTYQGIGLRDIVRIREEKGIPYEKPHMAGAWRNKNEQ